MEPISRPASFGTDSEHSGATSLATVLSGIAAGTTDPLDRGLTDLNEAFQFFTLRVRALRAERDDLAATANAALDRCNELREALRVIRVLAMSIPGTSSAWPEAQGILAAIDAAKVS